MASRSNKTVRYAQPTMVSSAPKTPPTSSVANSVRSAVSSRKPATTGVARAVMDATDRNGNRLGARRQVGEADPATRRAALNAALQPGPAVKPAPAAAPATNATLGLGAGINGKKRSNAIDDYTTRIQR